MGALQERIKAAAISRALDRRNKTGVLRFGTLHGGITPPAPSAHARVPPPGHLRTTFRMCAAAFAVANATNDNTLTPESISLVGLPLMLCLL
jgi:hypothetical protein